MFHNALSDVDFYAKNIRVTFPYLRNRYIQNHSTVTDLAKFLGWSMSVPRKRATSYERI